MAASRHHARAIWLGTVAEQAAVTPSLQGIWYWATDTDKLYYWNGTEWIVMGGAAIDSILTAGGDVLVDGDGYVITA